MPVVVKSGSFSLLVIRLDSLESEELPAAFAQRFGAEKDFFAGEPAVLDLGDVAEGVELGLAVELCRQYGLRLIGVCRPSEALAEEAKAYGLAVMPMAGRVEKPVVESPPEVSPVVEEVPMGVSPSLEVPDETGGWATQVVRQPVRSGQQIYAREANLVVVGNVSPGAEVVADGSVHVYGQLRGRAVAGARGDENARIFATGFVPELVSIAGIYRLFDTPLPEDVAEKAAQARLEGAKLVLEALNT